MRRCGFSTFAIHGGSSGMGTDNFGSRKFNRQCVRRSAPVRDCVGVAGERSYCADHRRATPHAGMGDVLKIARSETVFQQRGCDGRNRQPVSAMRAGEEETRLPIRLSPTATRASVRPCSWTFTSVAIFGSHNRSQSSGDFFLTTPPVPPTWRRLAGATGSFARIVRRRESRSVSQIVLASCAAAIAAVTPD